MTSPTLTLGILAHVDAGKTTLTERLLYDAGSIDRLGAVDEGTTRTDTLALERQRGITIRSAVAAFSVGDLAVTLIDTPGHPDFIAEVERSLAVLDGAVLVLSAVEGVQPQTRILMRALQRLRVPTLLFVNKVDRRGADIDRVLGTICRRLTPAVVPMATVQDAGTREAVVVPSQPQDPGYAARLTEVLAEHDEALLTAYLEETLDPARLRRALITQTARAQVYPVFAGSALTGVGVAQLTAAIGELLPRAGGDPDAPLGGRVFSIARGPGGEKVALVRLSAGTLRIRQRVGEDKVTAMECFDHGAWVAAPEIAAGGIARLWGLAHARIGDRIGAEGPAWEHHFAPPTLESVVVPVHPADRSALRAALDRLAEQDPLIDVRQDDDRRELSVTLYGEVQKEVLQATLAADHGVEVEFRDSSVLCVERPAGVGEAVERLHGEGNPFHATIGIRVEPSRSGSGVEFRLAVDTRFVPMYVYQGVEAFTAAMASYVASALTEGLHGWRVTDCVLTLVESGYSVADGPPSLRGPTSTAADFRKLTPIVVMRALADAGVVVCEPASRVSLEVPLDALGPVHAAVARLAAAVHGQTTGDDLATLVTDLPTAKVPDLQRQLPGLTGGEGVLTAEFTGYRPVTGPAPTRRRSTPDPLDRPAYLRAVGAPAS